ncbi:hypothetical protein ACRC7T_13450 [Segnochrobactraceae bacterium EtOH-i3]
MSVAELNKDTDLGDESFMSADDLRVYVQDMKKAQAAASEKAAEAARKALIDKLSHPVDMTPEFVHELKSNLAVKIRLAAERGEKELLVMRFPNALCSDQGRAINNDEPGWPDTLTGRPRQAFELWRDHLKPGNYGLKAMVIDWPGGVMGDIGFFLTWGEK